MSRISPPGLAGDWPAGGLESVPACPVCGATAREPVHRGLRDRIFRCAPGEWQLFRCPACTTGYLDPRPNPATIGLAYTDYYTHGSAAPASPRPRSAWRRHRVAQRNAYLNQYYGYQASPAAARSPSWLSRSRSQRFGSHVGYLRFPGRGARLLDVGCGNGGFLLQMRAVGWEVAGVEPDPASGVAARAAGLDVREGMLETAGLPEAHFDAVTMNHVVEHLHDPMTTLRWCHRALKPGGIISIGTPNFAAAGHRVFGPNWFALDPPRHLVLFTPASLVRALQTAGFTPLPAIQPRLVGKELFRLSMHLRHGGNPLRREPPLPLPAKLQADWGGWQANRATRAHPELGEEIVILARRPDL